MRLVAATTRPTAGPTSVSTNPALAPAPPPTSSTSTLAGTLTGLTGLGSSGTITFSGLNTLGIVKNNASGVLSTGLIQSADVATGTFANITGVGTLTGLAVNGTSAFVGATSVTGAT